MRILLANPYAPPTIGGVENSLIYIANALKEAGHEVEIFSLDKENNGHVGFIECIRVRRTHYKGSRNPILRYRRLKHVVEWELPRVLEDFDADEIWCRNGVLGESLIKVCKSKGIKLKMIYPTLASLHHKGTYKRNSHVPFLKQLYLKSVGYIEYQYLKKVEKRLVHSAINIVFSNMMKRHLQTKYKGIKVSVIDPGVDSRKYYPNRSNEKQHFAGLSFDFRKEKYILYVGRLSTAKNVAILIDAMCYIEEGIKLVIVGDGDDKENLLRLVKKLSLNDRIVFLGKQKELLPSLYSFAKATVLPTLIETFGQTYIESLACGTPVVGFGGDNPMFDNATSEIIKEGNNGYIARDYSSEDLAQAINRTIQLPEEAINVKDVHYHYSWRTFVKKLTSI